MDIRHTIRTKLLIYSIIITVLLFAPFELYLFYYIEKEMKTSILIDKRASVEMLSMSIINILLMNGGDIAPSSVDAIDMMRTLEPLKKQGLVYADTILKIEGKNYNRVVGELGDRANVFDLVRELDNVRFDRTTVFRESFGAIAGEDRYIVLVAPGTLNSKVVIHGRMIYDKNILYESIYRFRDILFSMTIIVIAVGVVSIIFLTKNLTRPITQLTESARKLSGGDLDVRAKVSSNDEIGILATSFNIMAESISANVFQLRKTNSELEEANRLKDDFIASTSHELKTPLNGILGIMESIMNTDSLEVDLKKNMDLVYQSGQRLLGLVEDLLDFSSITRKELVLNRQMVDLGEVVEHVYTLMVPLAQKKGLTLEKRIPFEERACFIDKNRIQQVLVNLVENAIKFTEEGTVEIIFEILNDQAVLKVIDTGEGIDPVTVDRLFEVFAQGESSLTRKHGGTGLGLAISKQLVELHGGVIFIVPGESQGSVVTVYLPLNHEFQYGDEKPAPIETGNIKESKQINSVSEVQVLNRRETGAAVLIVDDEPVNSQVLVNHLSSEGYEIAVTVNGEEALDYLEFHPLPDVIILDIMMPGLDGYEVCRKIRDKWTMYELPVLMLTALQRTRDLEKGFQAGANDFLSKPFRRNELISRIHTLITMKQAVASERELDALAMEMEIARQIQQAILPKELPVLQGIDMAVHFRPMREIGGDLYDFQTFREPKLGILMADVTGHGTPAAIISSMVKVIFAGAGQDAEYPEYLLKRCNTMLTEYATDHYLTALYVLIDLKIMQVSVARGAHWPLYIYRKKDDEIIKVKPRGGILGLKSEINFLREDVPIFPGDRLFFFTDGILEEVNEKGEIFGEDRFIQWIRESAVLTVHDALGTYFTRLEEWSGKEKDESFEDDASLLICDITSEAGE